MNELFAPCEIASLLNKYGYTEKCFKYWITFYKDKIPYLEDRASAKEYFNKKEIDNWGFPAPIYQQVLIWLHDKGVIVRVASNGVGFEVKAIEWDDFIFYRELDVAIMAAFKICELAINDTLTNI